MQLEHRYYADPGRVSNAVDGAYAAVVVGLAGLVLVIVMSRDGLSWTNLVGPLVILCGAAYAYMRIRAGEVRPVLQITSTHLRWRLPSRLMFREVSLAGVTGVGRTTDGALQVVRANGVYDVVPLSDMALRGGSFTAEVIEQDLTRAVAEVQSRQHPARQDASRAERQTLVSSGYSTRGEG
jgi:hypothetical protein